MMIIRRSLKGCVFGFSPSGFWVVLAGVSCLMR